jgi:hypothetical protein
MHTILSYAGTQSSPARLQMMPAVQNMLGERDFCTCIAWWAAGSTLNMGCMHKQQRSGKCRPGQASGAMQGKAQPQSSG